MKMTKQQGHEYLKQCKVFLESSEKSEKIQKKLFQFGFKWASMYKVVRTRPIILCTLEDAIYPITTMKRFEELTYCKLLTADDILNIELVDDPTFKVGDLVVLKKNHASGPWIVSHFGFDSNGQIVYHIVQHNYHWKTIDMNCGEYELESYPHYTMN